MSAKRVSGMLTGPSSCSWTWMTLLARLGLYHHCLVCHRRLRYLHESRLQRCAYDVHLLAAAAVAEPTMAARVRSNWIFSPIYPYGSSTTSCARLRYSCRAWSMKQAAGVCVWRRTAIGGGTVFIYWWWDRKMTTDTRLTNGHVALGFDWLTLTP
jgi:hypothetical protein